MPDGIEIKPLSQCLWAHMPSTRSHENRIAKQRVQGLALATFDESDSIADFMHRDRRALTIKVLEFLHNLRCRCHLRTLAQDFYLIATTDELAVKTIPKHLQELIPFPQKRIGFFMIFKDNLLF